MTGWGTVADSTGRHRLVLAAIVLAMAATFMLFLIPVASLTLRFVSALGIFCLYSFFNSGILPLTDFQALRMLERHGTFSKDL